MHKFRLLVPILLSAGIAFATILSSCGISSPHPVPPVRPTPSAIPTPKGSYLANMVQQVDLIYRHSGKLSITSSTQVTLKGIPNYQITLVGTFWPYQDLICGNRHGKIKVMKYGKVVVTAPVSSHGTIINTTTSQPLNTVAYYICKKS